MKRVLSVLLALALLTGLLPVGVFAGEEVNPAWTTVQEAENVKEAESLKADSRYAVGDNEYLEFENNDIEENANIIENDYTVYGETKRYDVDYYVFEIKEKCEVAFLLASERPDLTIQIWTQKPHEIVERPNYTEEDELYYDGLIRVMEPGVYYAAVFDVNSPDLARDDSYIYMMYFTYVPASQHKHDYVDVITAPTCTEQGYTTHTCLICDNAYVDTYVKATGHSMDEGVITTEPTTTNNGIKTYTCTECGYTETELIPGIDPRNPFNDVFMGKFYYKAVLWAVENKITSGITTTTFVPDEACTRGQVVTFLWRAAGKPTPTTTSHNFTDVREGGFYFKAMLWAVENGVTSGTSKTRFSPEEPCTRGQVVTFLYRCYN